jgi:hypothetical protein
MLEKNPIRYQKNTPINLQSLSSLTLELSNGETITIKVTSGYYVESDRKDGFKFEVKVKEGEIENDSNNPGEHLQ